MTNLIQEKEKRWKLTSLLKSQTQKNDDLALLNASL